MFQHTPKPLAQPLMNTSLLTELEIHTFIRNHYKTLSNQQLADMLGIPLSSIRTVCYQLGLKRMEMENFTTAQITYLRRHYTIKGDSELAEIFEKKWPKQKGWTKKHIEKKRKYLGLKRTNQQIITIHHRNKQAGRFAECPVKAWNKRGRAPDGEIRYWKLANSDKKLPVIKENGRFVHWGRWAWKKNYGSIPAGKNVVFADMNPFNLSLTNLILLSNQELAQRNAKQSSTALSDNYIAGLLSHNDPSLRKILKEQHQLLHIKRQQLTLNRTIYEHSSNQKQPRKHEG